MLQNMQPEVCVDKKQPQVKRPLGHHDPQANYALHARIRLHTVSLSGSQALRTPRFMLTHFGDVTKPLPIYMLSFLTRYTPFTLFFPLRPLPLVPYAPFKQSTRIPIV